MMGATGATRPNRLPFTATQWQELEHQALIYKYMVYGVPIPHELIFSIRRSLDSSFTSSLIPHQPIGWGCFQVGFGRKPNSEPGRCKRTDGKKWRCSREAFPGSKYCEKHMHRGRNRSRTSSTTTLETVSSDNILNISTDSLSHKTHQNSPKFGNAYLGRSLYPSSSSSSSCSESKPPESGLLLQSISAQMNVFGSGSRSQTDSDFSYLHGTGESVDEKSFFPEASGSTGPRILQDPSYQKLTMSSPYSKNYSSQPHCFVMGRDMFKSTRSINKPDKEQEDAVVNDHDDDDESKMQFHHFFRDDWPPAKNTSDSWLDLASNSRLHTGS